MMQTLERPLAAKVARAMRPHTFASYELDETDRDVATRLAFLEMVDPSQRRPTPKPGPNVDWIEHD